MAPIPHLKASGFEALRIAGQADERATGCDVLTLLETFCREVRSWRRMSMHPIQITQVPYCDSLGAWRAELLVGERRRAFRWDPHGPSQLDGGESDGVWQSE